MGALPATRTKPATRTPRKSGNPPKAHFYSHHHLISRNRCRGAQGRTSPRSPLRALACAMGRANPQCVIRRRCPALLGASSPPVPSLTNLPIFRYLYVFIVAIAQNSVTSSSCINATCERRPVVTGLHRFKCFHCDTKIVRENVCVQKFGSSR